MKNSKFNAFTLIEPSGGHGHHRDPRSDGLEESNNSNFMNMRGFGFGLCEQGTGLQMKTKDLARLTSRVATGGWLLIYALICATSTGRVQWVPRGNLLGLIDLNNTLTMYYFVLAVFLFGFAVVARAIASPFGQVIKAIRENEPRAISLGYRAEHYKLLAFILSAALTGLAGSTKALAFQFAALTDVDWTTSGEVVLMTLLGGVGTILGPVAGAFIVVTMENYLAQTGSWVTVIEGLIFVACVLTFRRGIVGVVAPYLSGRRTAPLRAERDPAAVETSPAPPA